MFPHRKRATSAKPILFSSVVPSPLDAARVLPRETSPTPYGGRFIDGETLGDAVSFLVHSFYQPDALSYGLSDFIGSPVYHRYMMRDVLLDIQALAEFLARLPTDHGVPRYETTLGVIYRRSDSLITRYPRDYVYGIVGIARIVMDRFFEGEVCRTRACTAYVPATVDYNLTSEEVFKQFTVKLMHGSIGVRAMALTQRRDSSRSQTMQSLNSSWTPPKGELPSRVPNLTDMGAVSLSTRVILTQATIHSVCSVKKRLVSHNV
ncbi:hypothetical protein F5Y17DRAFT_333475 [Xylariaceae sp. FL0594]|nr:hypothetical protein F5Y17DRAFT_333475 [Xylariaceae sp. FL0594]